MFKVCVIEDEIILRKGLIASIDWGDLNCEVVGEAGNGKEGIKLIEKEKPDLIILDINMPIMDGLEMISKLPANMFAFIIVSGHSEFSYAKRAIRYDVSEYLLKPLDHELLEEAIERAIEDLEMRRYFISRESENKKESFHILDLDKKVDSITLSVALDYIASHYHEKLTMEDLKQVTQKSSTSISNRFQSHLNLSFNDYLTRYRMQRAVNLIKELKYHLYEVGEQVGFSDYKYFNQVFKKVVGVSPKIVETYYLRK